MGFMNGAEETSGDRLLSAERIEAARLSLADWEFGNGVIRRDFTAPSFLDGIAFVGRIAAEAESRNHHPDIDIRWRTVAVALSSHTAGGITELDIALAGAIDDIYDTQFS